MTSIKRKFSNMTLADRLIAAREAKGLKQYQLAKLVGIAQQSLQAIENGETKQPRRLKKIAEVLDVTPEWLQFNAGNPPSYLDVSTTPEGKVPLIPWHSVKTWVNTYDLDSIVEPFRAGVSRVGDSLGALEFISIPEKKNDKQFALRIKGDSMTSPIAGKRTFLENEVIVIDPEKEFKDGDYVIALQKDEPEAMFLQYAPFGGIQYLKPLNPQYPLIKLDQTVKICGVVVTHLDVLV